MRQEPGWFKYGKVLDPRSVWVDTIEDSPILSLIDRIFEMKRKGETILGLHIGEPDFETPAGIRSAAAEAMDLGLTHYTSSQGMPELRAGIARYLARRHGMTATAEDVVVMPAKFAIYATLLATVEPGNEVLLPDPTYLFDQPVRLVGAKPRYFPLRTDFSLDPERLAESLTDRSRVLLFANPGNPTGQVFEREDMAAALQVAHDHGVMVVSDETYESLVYEGTHAAAATLDPGHDQVVTIGSFSKIFAMTGWRIGYVVAPPTIRARLVKVIEHTLTCVAPFIQEAASWGLDHAEPDAQRFREEFRRRRDRLMHLLEDIPGLRVMRPRGAFYVFPEFDLPFSSIVFSERLLEEEKMAVVPGVAFGPAGERHVRISYTRPLPELEDGARRLAQFMARHRPTAANSPEARPGTSESRPTPAPK
ncbi:MAG: aminotransferase class I/II-fold pyridoxal phosphate-dependent enzyme [Thermoplasmata archaeon]